MEIKASLSTKQFFMLGDAITSVTGAQINELYTPGVTRVLVGCAPCQPFSSMASKYRKSDEEKKKHEQDTKWNLLTQFGRIISESLPDIISIAFSSRKVIVESVMVW